MVLEPDSFDELFVPLDVGCNPLPSDIRLPASSFFPPPTSTTPEGLLCIGGRLSPEWLLDAYRHGIFPWPMWDDEPIAWWSPDPRAIIELDGFHVSRRLKRTIRSGAFRVTCDEDFEGVIRGCATSSGRGGNTWLTQNMIAAYCRMHRLGHAHSVEVWAYPRLSKGESRSGGALDPRARGTLTHYPSPKGRGELVGGTYGIAIGGVFAAESMFHHVRDASKVALANLVGHLKACGYKMLDIQQWTPHTGSLGATEISREEYLRRLARGIELPITFQPKLAADLRFE
jgi:leucyl/phenylalanyl-tRNA---protein transferase